MFIWNVKYASLCEYISDGDYLIMCELILAVNFFAMLPFIRKSSKDGHVPEMSLLFFCADCDLAGQIMKLSILICQL